MSSNNNWFRYRRMVLLCALALVLCLPWALLISLLVAQDCGAYDKPLGYRSSTLQPLTSTPAGHQEGFGGVALHLPGALELLPQLAGSSLVPSMHLGNNCRTDTTVRLVVGVVSGSSAQPGAARRLLDTVNHLIYKMAPDEEEMSRIIVLVAQTDLTYLREVETLLKNTLSWALDSGLLEVFSPPDHFYPLEVKVHTESRVSAPRDSRWLQTKKTLDLGLLISQAHARRAELFLLLEEGVRTEHGFVTAIMDLVIAYRGAWRVIDLWPERKLAGKLVHGEDLARLALVLLQFHRDHEPRTLLELFVDMAVCTDRMDKVACRTARRAAWKKPKSSQIHFSLDLDTT